MDDLGIKILVATYSTLLPILLGYIARQVSTMKRTKTESREAFSCLSEKLDDLTRIVSENQMRNSRYRIIRFDDEKASGIAHSEDHCDQILEDCDIYKTYCVQHPKFQNHKGQGAMKRIELANQNGTLKKGGYDYVPEQCIQEQC